MTAPKFKPMETLLRLENPAQEQQLCAAIANFKGIGTTLEAALGALIMGQHYGTRVLRMNHSPATIRKYERILGLSYDDLCPKQTHLSERNRGIWAAEKFGAFWDIVMGRKKVNNKGSFSDTPEKT